MVSKIVAFFNQPFPSSIETKDIIKESAIVGFLIFIILFLLQPFGLNGPPLSETLQITLSFGLMTFGVSLVFHFFLIRVLGFHSDKPSWTFGKWILSTFILILIINVANFLYMAMVMGYLDFTWSHFMSQLYATLIVAIFPVVFFGTITMMNRQRKYEDLAKDIKVPDILENEQGTIDTITIPNQSISLVLTIQDILYVEAMQNYATIHLVDGRTEIVRSTLKSLVDILAPHNIIRSHRSYLVNLKNVKKVSGNAQGLKLSMKDSEEMVPVSRKYIAIVRAHLNR